MLSLFFNVVNAKAGVILGLENLLEERKGASKWVIKLPKISACRHVVVLFVLAIFFRYFSPPAAASTEILIANKIGFTSPSQTAFGFIVTISFYKADK